MKAPFPRRAFTLIELLVVLAILGVFLAILLPAVQKARAAVARISCANKLRQIGLALHLHHDAHGALPPGVSFDGGASPQPFLSWNARLLPFLEQEPAWAEAVAAFSADRDFLSPPHKAGRSRAMPPFACPADPRAGVTQMLLPGFPIAFTSYLGVEGMDQRSKDGLLYLDSSIRFQDITDGASNTLMAGERPPSPDGRLGWWYAGWGQDRDGSAEMVLGVAEKVGPGRFDACPDAPYAYAPGDPANLCDSFHFWSYHSGGANFLFADGGVRFLPYSAGGLLPALATRAGGEPAEDA
jgi:prepilin-type N-terminal cleavage/methylation domain-containing protein/prepilin-type processing-associated H-X9-DG protein